MRHALLARTSHKSHIFAQPTGKNPLKFIHSCSAAVHSQQLYQTPLPSTVEAISSLSIAENFYIESVTAYSRRHWQTAYQRERHSVPCLVMPSSSGSSVPLQQKLLRVLHKWMPRILPFPKPHTLLNLRFVVTSHVVVVYIHTWRIVWTSARPMHVCENGSQENSHRLRHP